MGEELVFPLMFVLGIQPNTDLEERLLSEGYLSNGYNPLSLTPWNIKKMLYNPAPLNTIIAKACLAAWGRKHGSQDPRPWSGSLSHSATQQQGHTYAGTSLSKGFETNSGRDALLTLEEILCSRRPADSQPLSSTSEPNLSR